MSNDKPIRIRLRSDTTFNWDSQLDRPDTKGNLSYGEIGVKIDENENGEVFVKGYLGVYESPTFINSCPLIFNSQITVDSETSAIKYFSIPIVYDKQEEEIEDNSIVIWNEQEQKWKTETQSVILNSFPTQSGTVVYDPETFSFTVGEVVSAKEIDGGDYGGTDE